MCLYLDLGLSSMTLIRGYDERYLTLAGVKFRSCLIFSINLILRR